MKGRIIISFALFHFQHTRWNNKIFLLLIENQKSPLSNLNNEKEAELRKSAFQLPGPEYSPDTILWPKGDILPDEKPADVNYARLNQLINTCFDAPGNGPYKKTLGIVVVYDNQIVAEKYLDGYDAKTMFHGWSMTKTITGALAGILHDEGKLFYHFRCHCYADAERRHAFVGA